MKNKNLDKDLDPIEANKNFLLENFFRLENRQADGANRDHDLLMNDVTKLKLDIDIMNQRLSKPQQQFLKE